MNLREWERKRDKSEREVERDRERGRKFFFCFYVDRGGFWLSLKRASPLHFCISIPLLPILSLVPLSLSLFLQGRFPSLPHMWVRAHRWAKYISCTLCVCVCVCVRVCVCVCNKVWRREASGKLQIATRRIRLADK